MFEPRRTVSAKSGLVHSSRRESSWHQVSWLTTIQLGLNVMTGQSCWLSLAGYVGRIFQGCKRTFVSLSNLWQVSQSRELKKICVFVFWLTSSSINKKNRWFNSWPFDPLVGGHLTIERVTDHHPKKAHKELPGTEGLCFFQFCNDWALGLCMVEHGCFMSNRIHVHVWYINRHSVDFLC